MAKRIAVFFLAVMLLTTAQVGLHRLRHDLTGEFSGNGDEASHFVTGLMIRDYLVQDLGHNPVRFAKMYYLHYPKVAFGSWPPLLHIGVGLWMLLMPPSRQAAVLYTDVVTAMLAIAAGIFARRRLPLALALVIGVAVWLAPITQEMTQLFLADIQYALLSMVCVYVFATYLDEPGHAHAFGFGLTLLASVMTKNNGLFLGISVPLVILVTRQFRILKRWDLWVSILPGILFVGVWQYLTLPFNINNMTGRNAETAFSTLFVTNFVELAKLPWIGLTPLVLWGVWRRIAQPLLRNEPVNTTDAASFGLMLGAPLFHATLPHGAHMRYLIACLAPMLIFCVEAVLDLAWIPNRGRIALAAGLVVVPAMARPVHALPHSSYGSLADAVIREFPASTQPSILVSGGFGQESTIVAELAIRDRRPGHWALRATKILRYKVGVFNRDTEVVATPQEDMVRYFQELPVSMVVLVDDGDLETKTSYDYLAAMIHGHHSLFRLVSTTPIGMSCQNAPCTMELYQFMGATAGARFNTDKLPQNMPLWQGM